ncbi:MAG: hypothetical protein JO165_05035 [Candidatus Eremiobacteraeota bacterium]|nr:hypothetical protein [Candidatus Eremiobacteraeota bacterium]
MPSNSPLLSIAIAVVFLTGAALFGLGTIARRKQKPRVAGTITWPRLVDEALADADLDQRIEMIERLGIVRSAWACDVLQTAQREESDPRATRALERALSAATST